jgi:hypothetical protein
MAARRYARSGRHESDVNIKLPESFMKNDSVPRDSAARCIHLKYGWWTMWECCRLRSRSLEGKRMDLTGTVRAVHQGIAMLK